MNAEILCTASWWKTVKKAPEGWTHSKTLTRMPQTPCARSVLECVRPSAAFVRATAFNPSFAYRADETAGPAALCHRNPAHLTNFLQTCDPRLTTGSRRGCKNELNYENENC